MIFIGPNRFLNDIRANLWKLTQYKLAGIIGIPRSGMIAATTIAEELHIGVCSNYEFIDNNGDNKVFDRHGVRLVEHNDANTYLVIDDSCCRGSMGEKVKELKEAFPDKTFISVAVYVCGLCELYKPDIIMVNLLNDPEFYAYPKRIVLHYYNVLDNQFSSNILYDLDGVMCVDPPDDANQDAYEAYLNYPKILHIPPTTPKNPIDICTYRLYKYEKETRNFLKRCNVNVGKLMMYPAATIEVRNLVPSAYYKAQHYKDNKYFLFVESNDQEAQQICRLSGKPVYCYQTGKFYKYNK